ncbi:hypothetical protein F0562_003410 [Nyssa sinensis]|uniref:Uncharacterized protein n=1 Tax=Nyssa sinensis TaxID=561372 RepID=A0A5J5C0J3_9ASTE|nr:hypothetical protein F0562_003410 [Nyssa sinensis]
MSGTPTRPNESLELFSDRSYPTAQSISINMEKTWLKEQYLLLVGSLVAVQSVSEKAMAPVYSQVRVVLRPHCLSGCSSAVFEAMPVPSPTEDKAIQRLETAIHKVHKDLEVSGFLEEERLQELERRHRAPSLPS